MAAVQEDLQYVQHFPKAEKYVSLLRQAEESEAQVRWRRWGYCAQPLCCRDCTAACCVFAAYCLEQPAPCHAPATDASCTLCPLPLPRQARLEAERARLRAVIKRQLAEAAMLAEADEGAGLAQGAAPAAAAQVRVVRLLAAAVWGMS